MTCKLNNTEVSFPCSRNCPLFGDCVVEFEKQNKKPMTDNEIIMALECCTGKPDEGLDCTVCPFMNADNCMRNEELALDLINRQKAEIERLKSGCKRLVEKQNLYKENMQATREYQIEQAKAEAVKEFAERLKEELTTGRGVMRMSTLGIIDYLVKEMVGDSQ